MPLSGVADSEQLAVLTNLLDDYSTDIGIVGDAVARERLAVRILRLFTSGLTQPDDIRRALDLSFIQSPNDQTEP